MFLVGGVLLFFLVKWTGDWIWGSFVRHPNPFALLGMSLMVALGVGITMYRNERIYGLANEVASELRKVTWPTLKEVRSATIVVIVAVIIAAAILGLFDAVWSALTDLVYG
jgi:preprotein translocase subunit SecE